MCRRRGGMMVDGKKTKRKLALGPLILFIVVQLLEAAAGEERALHPLVLVPGSVGSQLEARLTATYRPSSRLCGRWTRTRKTKDGWFRLWFDPSLLVAPFTRCFAERMTLYYHPELDDYRNAPGVETRVPHFGSTLGLLYRDPHLKHMTEYMATLVRTMEEMGYRDGESLFGAPYDFRYGLAAEGHPSEVGSAFLRDLKELVENATKSNGGKPAILVSHSLGGLFVLQLLSRSSRAWRQKFVKHFVALSAPWGGAVRTMLTFASGYSVGIPGLDPLLVRDEQRSSESNLWLLPSPATFGGAALVVTLERNYSAGEMAEFLKDVGFDEGVAPYKARIWPLAEKLPSPGVALTNIVGTGVKTPERLVYGKEGFDRQPEIVYGDGDGTVNLDSLLRLAAAWGGRTGQFFKLVNISRVCHKSILKNEAAVRVIMQEICEINSSLLGFEPCHRLYDL